MTKKNNLTLAQQRELLNLQAENLRLKMMVQQLKAHSSGHKPVQWGEILSLLNLLPLSRLALKLSNKPKRWRNKLLLSVLFLLSTLWLKQSKTNRP